jgi:glyoxylase-like metal-dependent hydrolase (beta-lactamase superfamily II)
MKIDRRQFIALSSGALAVSPVARVLGAQQVRPPQPPGAPGGTLPLPPTQIPAQAPPPAVPKFEDVRRNVGIFTMRGGTIGWLVNKDGVLAVDTQFPDTAKVCVDGIKQKAAGRGLDLVINTHHHADHTGGNAVFRAEAKKLVAQAGVPALQKEVAAATPNSAAPVVADATFDKAWGEKIGDERVTATFNGPGHTGADAIVHFERAHVVHMGDLLFVERHPRVDRAAGASIQNWMKILEKVNKDFPADTIFIAGHAKDGLPLTTDRKALLRFRDYFDAVLALTRKGIAAGQTKEALVATAALPGFEGYQGGGALSLSGVLGVAFDELTAK